VTEASISPSDGTKYSQLRQDIRRSSRRRSIHLLPKPNADLAAKLPCNGCCKPDCHNACSAWESTVAVQIVKTTFLPVRARTGEGSPEQVDLTIAQSDLMRL
jgi:hypothetical protein